MSAVDAPPGLSTVGTAVGEFRSRPGPRRLAQRAFIVACLAGGTTMAIASRKLYHPLIEILFVGPLVTISIAAVGLAVRRARVRVGRGGVRWGWDWLGFQLGRDRLERVVAYDDAVAAVPRKGSAWFLSARDWDEFARFGAAFRRAGIPLETVAGRAPVRARLQGYGRVLDAMLVVDLLGAVALLALALA